MSQYELKFGKVTAKVNSLGAELTSFISDCNQEYIWQGDPNIWNSHSPLLFPVVCTPKDGKIITGGHEYAIEKHGIVRKREFTLNLLGEDFIDLILHSDAQTKQSYPFDFTLHVTHKLHKDGFSTTFTVENKSSIPMPFCIGGHPGFICPMHPDEQFTDYIIKFEHTETGENSLAPGGGLITGTEYLPNFKNSNTLEINHTLFDERDALIFADIKSRYADLIHKTTGKGLRFTYPKFEALGIWTAPDKQASYVCLEPWSGLPASITESGLLEDKPYVKTLKPEESYITGYSMTILN